MQRTKTYTMEYEINGGVNTINGDIDWMEVHRGVLYVKGKVGTLVHHGGIIYDKRPANSVEFKTEKMSEEERQKYRRKITELERKLDHSEYECLNLREKLANKDAEQPCDDVLVMRIESLEQQLERERRQHRKEVEELQERIDVALEINARLRRKVEPEIGHSKSQQLADEHIDILATLLALYPFTPDKDIEFEFGIPSAKISMVAKILSVIKSPEARREAAEYLRKQHIEFIERRGGDQSVTPQVEMVSRNGKVLNTFKDAEKAARKTGYSSKTVRSYCHDYLNNRRYTNEGFTFRYKEEPTKD